MFEPAVNLLITFVIAPVVTYILATLKARRELVLSEQHARGELAALAEKNRLEIEAAEERSRIDREKLLNDMVEQFRKDIAVKEKELHSARSAAAAAHEVRAAAESQVDELRIYTTQLLEINRQTLAANEKLANDLRESNRQLIEANKQLGEMHALKAELAGLRRNFEAINGELLKRDRDLERLRQERDAAHRDLNVALERLEQYAALPGEMVFLRDQVDTMRSELEEARKKSRPRSKLS